MSLPSIPVPAGLEICYGCGGDGGCPGADFGDYGWHPCYKCFGTGYLPDGTADRETELANEFHQQPYNDQIG
jgi:hypothetical protein